MKQDRAVILFGQLQKNWPITIKKMILYVNFTHPIMETNIKKEDTDMMKEMFQDYKTMVVEPKKEFNKMYRKEIILLNVAVYAVLIGGSLVLSNQEKIKERIKSKFNKGKRDWVLNKDSFFFLKYI